jgi:hypothetical protein
MMMSTNDFYCLNGTLLRKKGVNGSKRRTNDSRDQLDLKSGAVKCLLHSALIKFFKSSKV